MRGEEAAVASVGIDGMLREVVCVDLAVVEVEGGGDLGNVRSAIRVAGREGDANTGQSIDDASFCAYGQTHQRSPRG